MAFFAGSVKPCSPVRRARRCRIRLAMAPIAIHRDIHIFLLLLIDVAGLAGKRLVCPYECESGPPVALCHVWNKPRLGLMATFTRTAKLVAMDILMTIGTPRRGAMKLHRLMALPAGYLCMLPLQRKSSASVIETLPCPHILPG